MQDYPNLRLEVLGRKLVIPNSLKLKRASGIPERSKGTGRRRYGTLRAWRSLLIAASSPPFPLGQARGTPCSTFLCWRSRTYVDSKQDYNIMHLRLLFYAVSGGAQKRVWWSWQPRSSYQLSFSQNGQGIFELLLLARIIY